MSHMIWLITIWPINNRGWIALIMLFSWIELFSICAFLKIWFEGMLNLMKIRWPRPRLFFRILSVGFSEWIGQRCVPNLKSSALLDLDIVDGRPEFIGSRPRPRLLSEKIICPFWMKWQDVWNCAKLEMFNFTGFGTFMIIGGIPYVVRRCFPMTQWLF